MKKKVLFTLALIVAFLIFFFVVLFLTKPQKTQDKKALPTPLPVPTDFSVDYSKIRYLSPGKSTIKDLEKILGFPSSSSAFGNKTYFYYKTPGVDYKNVVLIENGVVSYALENVFGNYRGDYNSFINSYGQPSLHLFSTDFSSYDWYVFLKNGVAIESSNNFITKVLYFIPQSKEEFSNTIAKEVGMTENRPQRSPEAY